MGVTITCLERWKHWDIVRDSPRLLSARVLGSPNFVAKMACDAAVINAIYRTMANQTVQEEIWDTHKYIKFIVKDIATPAMCCFGILGNILNLIVLAQKQLQSSMDRLERSAHLGLVALATSDMIFCLLTFACSDFFWPTYIWYVGVFGKLEMMKKIYNSALLNTFLFSSTWLTIVIALGRYLAICHPLHTRSFINLRGTRAAILVVFLVSVLINLADFFEMYIGHFTCPTQYTNGTLCDCYTPIVTLLHKNHTFRSAYIITWAILGTFLPILILTVCNICLILALRRSHRMQRLYRANQPRDSGHRITPTLITIIILYTILVCPSEILQFIRYIVGSPKNGEQIRVYDSATSITNFMVTTNFAINFILYCAINVHFRSTITNLLCCRWYTTRRLEYKSSQHTYTYNLSEADTELQIMDMRPELNSDIVHSQHSMRNKRPTAPTDWSSGETENVWIERLLMMFTWSTKRDKQKCVPPKKQGKLEQLTVIQGISSFHAVGQVKIADIK